MHICFLSALHPPRDKRVFDKEALSLAAVGFEVSHVATGSVGDLTIQGVRILTEPASRGIWGRILSGPRLFLRAWKVHADCYHCNEVDSWIIGIALKVVTGCFVVFAAHEAYPEDFGERRFPRAIRPVIAASLRLLFRFLMLGTDRVVLAKESVARDYPDPSKRVLVRNYVSAGYADTTPTARQGSNAHRIRLIHLGLVSKLRGWPQILDAIAGSSELFEVVFVGQFNDGTEEAFWARAAQLDLLERVQVQAWVPFDEAFRMVCSSDVGIIAFQPGPYNHIHALPHKMFDYMVAGIPLIAPDFAIEVARVVRDSDCGLLIDVSDPASIRKALEYLATRPEERVRLGENGREAVRSKFNWEKEATRLEQMYLELSGRDESRLHKCTK